MKVDQAELTQMERQLNPFYEGLFVLWLGW